jgi:hypothetical protein
MPQLDTYYSLKNAYGGKESFPDTLENFVPSPVARSMKFNSSWSGKGSPPASPPIPRPGRYDDDEYERHRRRRPPPYYDYGNMYYPPLPPGYSYPYLPYFYNAYSYTPYNLTYSQYIPTMNAFWDSINTSIVNFPEYPGLSDIDRMKRFILDLPIFIPCNDACKSFMKVYISEQLSNLDAICQNKRLLIDFFQNLRRQFYIKFDLDNYNIV